MNGIVEQLANDINNIRPKSKLYLVKGDGNIRPIQYKPEEVIARYFNFSSNTWFYIVIDRIDPNFWLFGPSSSVGGLTYIIKKAHKGRTPEQFLTDEIKMYNEP